MLAEQLGQQMAPGNLDFFLHQVAREFNKLHAVEQRRIDSSGSVGGGYEQHIRQVIVNVDVIVVEGGILLGIKHFEQSRRGVALVIVAEFVHLVEQEHRIVHPGILHGLNDTAGHSTDICTAMTADLGLVVHAAERHTLILTIHGLGNRSAKRRLAHTRGSHKAYNRSFAASIIVHQHGYLFQDAFFYLFEAVMTLFKHFFGIVDFGRRFA